MRIEIPTKTASGHWYSCKRRAFVQDARADGTRHEAAHRETEEREGRVPEAHESEACGVIRMRRDQLEVEARGPVQEPGPHDVAP
jgi:hypothetical protein